MQVGTKAYVAIQFFLLAAPAAVGTGVWSVTKGSSTVAQPSKFNSSVSNLSFGENIFRWQIYNGSCPPAVFDEVKVYRDDTLVTADAGVDSSICFTDYILSGQLSPNTSGIWTLVSGDGTITDSAAMVTPVSGLKEGANIFRWKVSNTCNAVSDNVNITVYNFTKANAGADKEIYYSPLFAYPLAGQTPVGTGGNGAYAYIWNPSRHATYTYNGANKIATFILASAVPGDSTKFSREISTYDSMGYLTNGLYQNWKVDSSSWINTSKIDYLYLSDGRIYQTVSQVWNNTTKTWTNSQRITHTYMGTTDILDINDLVFKLYPNPSKEVLNITLINGGNALVKVVDIQGKAIISTPTFRNATTLNISDLSSGLYILHLQQDNKITTTRFVKE